MKTWHGEKLTTVQKNADYVSLYVLSSKLICIEEMLTIVDNSLEGNIMNALRLDRF